VSEGSGVGESSVTAATLPGDLGPDDLVLLGWPVAHSRSPAMHNAASTHLGLPLRYRALAVAPEELDDVVVALGACGVRGANVTVPHKLAVMPHCDVLTDEARLVGAVNTLTWERSPRPDVVDARLEGHNTDAVGLQAALAEDVGDLVGSRVLLVGTGGAARAAAVALVRAGAVVTVAGRDPRGCAAILEVVTATDQVGGAARGSIDLLDSARLTAEVGESRMVLNATSLGLAGEHLPLPCETLRADQVAYDLVYRPETPFLAAARGVGAQAYGGLGMLVHQAAAAFTRWAGFEAPVGVMKAALGA
jgi:shikimate dehydrogenase